MGEIVTDRLEENFRELMNYDFTAQMENSLDQVANHEAEWKAVLDHFFSDFTQQLDKAEKDPEEGDAPEPDGSDQHRLPDLWSQMGIRTASTGYSLAVPATLCHRKSVAKPPSTWCRKTKC